jgi:DNA repair exonuclease SbcCD nuclease subunit
LKILTYGDVHLGTSVDEDVIAAANNIADQAASINPDLIVITGDVYDGASTPADRENAKNIVVRLANIAPVSIIKGNHDVRRDLLILGGLSANNPISVHETPACVAYPVRGDLFVHYLPWLTKSSWVASQVGLDMGIQTGSDAVSLLALQFLKIQIAKHGVGKHILFAHLMVSGAIAENHQPLLGDGITFGYHDLAELGFAAGAFGHIHKSQSFGGAGSPEFRYNGAIAALNYGESARNKGFSVLDTDTMKFTVYPIPSVARINVNAFWNGTLTCKADALGLPTESGARVKVKLLIEEGYSPDDAEKAVRECPLIVNPLELKVERQSKPKDLVRAQEIAAAQTAAHKLAAYWAATNTEPEEPMKSAMLRITTEAEAECLIR